MPTLSPTSPTGRGRTFARPSANWLLRRAPGIVHDPVSFLLEVRREFGSVAHLRLGNRNLYLVTEPDAIRDILVTNAAAFEKYPKIPPSTGLFGDGLLTSEGDFHMRQRRLLQPAFDREHIARYATEMIRCGIRFRESIEPGERLDVAHEMARITMAIVSRTLFSAETDHDAGEISAALEEVLEGLNRLVMPLGSFRIRLPLPSSRRYWTALNRLDRVIYSILDSPPGSDVNMNLLSLMRQMSDAGERMTRRQLRDEIMTLFVAGHETTANGLAWTWYLLSQNPECERRFHHEIDTVLNGRFPEPDDYPRLPYVEQVFAESMRLLPPVWIMGRKARERVALDDWSLEAGEIALISPYVLHREARHFPDPERFDPERWSPASKTGRPRFSYLPFGAGSRLCIGERFAWAEGVLTLAVIGQCWRFRLASGARVEPKGMLTLRPRFGLPMIAESRKSLGPRALATASGIMKDL